MTLIELLDVATDSRVILQGSDGQIVGRADKLYKSLNQKMMDAQVVAIDAEQDCIKVYYDAE